MRDGQLKAKSNPATRADRYSVCTPRRACREYHANAPSEGPNQWVGGLDSRILYDAISIRELRNLMLMFLREWFKVSCHVDFPEHSDFQTIGGLLVSS